MTPCEFFLFPKITRTLKTKDLTWKQLKIMATEQMKVFPNGHRDENDRQSTICELNKLLLIQLKSLKLSYSLVQMVDYLWLWHSETLFNTFSTHVLPGCESIGEGEPDRDWKVAPFSGAIVVLISRLGEGSRPNTRLPPPGGPPFKDPLARSEIQCMHFKLQAYLTSLNW
jgi:hypothetical protein